MYKYTSEDKVFSPCTSSCVTKCGDYHMYTCGACYKTFQTICMLHVHLDSHGFGGSYYYSQQTRTAFPKFDSVCTTKPTDPNEVYNLNAFPRFDSVCTATQTDPNEVNNSDTLPKSDSVSTASQTDEVYNGSTRKRAGTTGGSTLPVKKRRRKVRKGRLLKNQSTESTKAKKVARMVFKAKWKCQICSELLNSQTLYINHMKIHNSTIDTGDTQHDLSKDLNDSNKVKTNSDLKNIPAPKYQCEKCGKLYQSQGECRRHYEICGVPIEERRNFQCSECGVCLVSKRSLRDHKNYVHAHKENQVCDICGGSFKHLAKHRLVHMERPREKCDLCPETFSSKTGLSRHRKRHKSQVRHSCGYCGKMFYEKWNLKAHMRQHTDEKPYKCTICGMGFTHNVSRKSHMAKHGIPIDPQPYCKPMENFQSQF